MRDTITIPDTSCLIVLSNLDLLDLLKHLYSEIRITNEIKNEFQKELPHWLEVQEPDVNKYSLFLHSSLDRGEASAIALGLTCGLDKTLLLIDDLKGRNIAKKLGFNITGTLGVLHKAKKEGHIENVRTYIDELKKKGFRISEKVEKELLKLSNE